VIDFPVGTLPPGPLSEFIARLLINLYISKETKKIVRKHRAPFYLQPVRIDLNASSTPVASKAEVSIKAKLFLSANAIASSVATARLCLKSHYSVQLE
jgi:hypothetical protein